MRRTLHLLERLEIHRPDMWKFHAPSPSAKKAWELSQGAVFTFKSQAMKDLWDEELRGQITDGHWENQVTTADLFWYDVPTKVGGSTSLKGKIPNGAHKNFNFADKPLLDAVGDRMLEIVRKHEKEATMDDLVAMLKEITKAVRAAKKDPMRSGETAGSTLDDLRKEVAWKAGVKKAVDPRFEQYMIGDVQGRYGKFHYFCVFKDPASGEYIGLSAYGKEGKRPKSVVIAKGDEDDVTKKVKKKVNAKSRKYLIAPLPEWRGAGRRTMELIERSRR